MSSRKLHLLLAAACLAAALPAAADLLKLSNGVVLSGRYDGGSSNAVRFSTSTGVQEIATADLASITFAAPPPPAAPAPPPAPPPAAPRTVTLPAGTVLTVRMMESVSSQEAAGEMFTTRLEFNVGTAGVIALPAGTVVYGKVTASTQERRVFGRSSLAVALTQASLHGNAVPLVTGNFSESAKTGGVAQAAGGAAMGAAVGGLIDGHEGAQSGAAWGAAVGVLRRGRTMTITPGTLLDFSLTAPLTLTVP